MARTIPAIVVTTAGLALGVALAQPAPAQASVVAYTFDILIDSGPLQPNSYSGSFAYDTNTFNLTSFSFNFQGTQYDASDDPDATVFIDNGVFLGLDYNIDTQPAFSFVPGFFAVDEAFFSYDLVPGTGQGGGGSLMFTRVVKPETSAVPGPLPLLGAAACFGYSRRLRQRLKVSGNTQNSSL